MQSKRIPKTDIEENATELIAQRQNNKLYNRQSSELNGKISDLVAGKMLILKDIHARGRIDLKNLEQVEAVTVAYLESCRAADVLPTFEGLAFSMGFSRQRLYSFLSSSADLPSADYLDRMRTAFADLMTQASLKRLTDNATSIFTLKNMSGLGYSDRGDIPPDPINIDNESTEELVRKYGHLLEE